MSSIRIISVLLIIFFCIGLISAPLSFNIKSPTDNSELFTENDFLLGIYAKNNLNLDDLFPDMQDKLNHSAEFRDWFFYHVYMINIPQAFNIIVLVYQSPFKLVYFLE